MKQPLIVLRDYSFLLYPQYCNGKLAKLSPEIFKNLQEKAHEFLSTENLNIIGRDVLKHWISLSKGENVTGMEIYDC